MVFEDSYEEELQMDRAFKQKIISSSDNAVWLFVDDQLAGETYGLTPRALKGATGEEIPDLDPHDGKSIYCYSTTVIPEFRGKNLANILKGYWIGYVFGKGHDRIIGHATSEAMYHINRKFAAVFGTRHEHWFDTDRVAHFYTITNA